MDKRFGFRGPFIFGIIVTAIELIGRLLIIERKEAIRWDASFTNLVVRNDPSKERVAYGAVQGEKRPEGPPERASHAQNESEDITETETPTRVPSRAQAGAETERQPKDEPSEPAQLSIPRLLFKLVRSPRALSAVFLTLSYG